MSVIIDADWCAETQVPIGGGRGEGMSSSLSGKLRRR
jgi:hypothetical protein